MSVVLDSCALLRWFGQGESLPEAAVDSRLLTPAVTWCEIAWKHRLGRLPLPLARDAWLAQCTLLVETVAVDRDLFLAAVDLDWAHRDPADRLIVALARREGALIATSDGAIRAYHPQCVW